ncbi:MAG TPA: hypothetical protein VK430_01130 [Xanthobacteraceae bacterium]|nr:hypothetical protein [Xanthobacteraceae bacterium]
MAAATARLSSAKLIAELIKLGYLRPAKRHKIGTVKNALARLRQDLCQSGVIWEGDLSRHLLPDHAEGQQERFTAPMAQ